MFKFMLALRTFLISSISKDLLWKEWQTITPDKDCKNKGVHRFTRALNNMHSQLIDKQGWKSITDEVEIRKLLYNIPDINKMCITPHLTNDMRYQDIVTQSKQLES